MAITEADREFLEQQDPYAFLDSMETAWDEAEGSLSMSMGLMRSLTVAMGSAQETVPAKVYRTRDTALFLSDHEPAPPPEKLQEIWEVLRDKSLWAEDELVYLSAMEK